MRWEVARDLVIARAHHLCEGCGRFADLDVHHRLARGSGGVYGVAAHAANDVRNLLALCRNPCHERTETAETWRECEALGWRFRHGQVDPCVVPALIHTVNGYGWYFLTEDGGYRWADLPAEYRIHLEVHGGTDQQGTASDDQEHGGDGVGRSPR